LLPLFIDPDLRRQNGKVAYPRLLRTVNHGVCRTRTFNLG
jgi:hypothetical protein